MNLTIYKICHKWTSNIFFFRLMLFFIIVFLLIARNARAQTVRLARAPLAKDVLYRHSYFLYYGVGNVNDRHEMHMKKREMDERKKKAFARCKQRIEIANCFRAFIQFHSFYFFLIYIYFSYSDGFSDREAIIYVWKKKKKWKTEYRGLTISISIDEKMHMHIETLRDTRSNNQRLNSCPFNSIIISIILYSSMKDDRKWTQKERERQSNRTLNWSV